MRLEQNYRSTKTHPAHRLDADRQQPQRKDKSALDRKRRTAKRRRCFSARTSTTKPTSIAAAAEASCTMTQGYDWNQMAIFYRMNSLSRVMEDALRRANVPYQIARGVEFYNRKEIKDVLAYLRVDRQSRAMKSACTRIVNVPARGLGDAAIKIMPTYAVVRRHCRSGRRWSRPRSVPGIPPRAVKSAAQFVQA